MLSLRRKNPDYCSSMILLSHENRDSCGPVIFVLSHRSCDTCGWMRLPSPNNPDSRGWIIFRIHKIRILQPHDAGLCRLNNSIQPHEWFCGRMIFLSHQIPDSCGWIMIFRHGNPDSCIWISCGWSLIQPRESGCLWLNILRSHANPDSSGWVAFQTQKSRVSWLNNFFSHENPECCGWGHPDTRVRIPVPGWYFATVRIRIPVAD